MVRESGPFTGLESLFDGPQYGPDQSSVKITGVVHSVPALNPAVEVPSPSSYPSAREGETGRPSKDRTGRGGSRSHSFLSDRGLWLPNGLTGVERSRPVTVDVRQIVPNDDDN